LFQNQSTGKELNARINDFRIHVVRILLQQGLPFSILDEVVETESWVAVADAAGNEKLTLKKESSSIPSQLRLLMQRDQLSITGRVSMSEYIPQVFDNETALLKKVYNVTSLLI
jgi:hypothetical protein